MIKRNDEANRLLGLDLGDQLTCNAEDKRLSGANTLIGAAPLPVGPDGLRLEWAATALDQLSGPVFGSLYFTQRSE